MPPPMVIARELVPVKELPVGCKYPEIVLAVPTLFPPSLALCAGVTLIEVWLASSVLPNLIFLSFRSILYKAESLGKELLLTF